MTGEPGCVQESLNARILADQRIVVRSDLVQARPAVRDAYVEQPWATPFHDLDEIGYPVLAEIMGESGGLLGMRHPQEHARTLSMEIEGGCSIDGHWHARRKYRCERVAERLGDKNLPAERLDWEGDASHGPDLLRPGARSTHDRAGTNRAGARLDRDTLGALGVNALDQNARSKDRAVSAGACRIAMNDRFGAAVAVARVECCCEHVIDDDAGSEFAGLAGGEEAAVDAHLLLEAYRLLVCDETAGTERDVHRI